ncbi:MAG: efflux RND transporter periplasmic adaptor subunit [Acidobacteriota bacterium]|nr:efflux RND transporter periplasmic adaptor subunit [Acidobacteriota bacterium]
MAPAGSRAWRAPGRTAPPAGGAAATTRGRAATTQATVTASGSVIAPRETALGPEVTGRLSHVFVDVGDTVTAGQPVFRIDHEPYRVAHEEAVAGLELAKAELDQAAQEMERGRRLTEQQVSPQQELDALITRHAVQKARVQQALARVHRARQDYERTLVSAPYTSFVVERDLHEGAMLNPGSVVVVLQQAGGFEAVIDVPEAARVTVVPGHASLLHVEGAHEPVAALVRAVNARIDPESRTYQARIPIPDSVAGVKAGAFVRAEISAAPQGESLLVDRDAILRRDGRTYVFRRSGTSVERVSVGLGAVGAMEVEVRTGLGEGDEIVVGEVIQRLSDGASVSVGR